MANNPIIYVDSDGRWVHLAIGAVVGGGIAAYDLHKKGELNLSWRTVGKIGVGSGVGVATAALPSAAIGASAALLGSSALAGLAGGTGEFLNQVIDVHTGYSTAINGSEILTNAAKSAITFGGTAKMFNSLRYDAITKMGTPLRTTFSNFVYRNSGTSSLLLGLNIDIAAKSFEEIFGSHKFQSQMSEFGSQIMNRMESLIYIIQEEIGFKATVKSGQVVNLPEIVLPPPERK